MAIWFLKFNRGVGAFQHQRNDVLYYFDVIDIPNFKMGK